MSAKTAVVGFDIGNGHAGCGEKVLDLRQILAISRYDSADAPGVSQQLRALALVRENQGSLQLVRKAREGSGFRLGELFGELPYFGPVDVALGIREMPVGAEQAAPQRMPRSSGQIQTELVAGNPVLLTKAAAEQHSVSAQGGGVGTAAPAGCPHQRQGFELRFIQTM